LSLLAGFQWVYLFNVIIHHNSFHPSKREEESIRGLVDSLISAPQVPPNLIKRLTRVLFEAVLAEGANPRTPASPERKWLATIRQRWGDVVDEIARELRRHEEADESGLHSDDDGTSDENETSGGWDVEEVIAFLSAVMLFQSLSLPLVLNSFCSGKRLRLTPRVWE